MYKLLLILSILFAILTFTLDSFTQDSLAEDISKPIEVHVSSNIRYIQYSPYGKLLAVVEKDFGIHVYNTQSLKKIYQLKDYVSVGRRTLKFSPDGEILAIPYNRLGTYGIYLRHASTGEIIRTLTGHSRSISSIAFSPDGKTIASSSADLTIGLWDIKRGNKLHTLIDHTREILDVAFSPDGKTLVSCGLDGLRVWDANTGRPLHTLTELGLLERLVFSPDKKTLATGNGVDRIYLLDANTYSLVHRINLLRSSDLGGYTREEFSPDGKKITFVVERKAHVWEVSTGKLLQTLDHSNSIALSPNGKLLATGSQEGPIHLWDFNTGEPIRTLIGHSDSVNSVAFSPDGRTLASSSSDGTVLLWEITPSQIPEDVNADGVVNILDLVTVANAFGESEPDLNGDGVVNILDLTLVASAFGNTVASTEE